MESIHLSSNFSEKRCTKYFENLFELKNERIDQNCQRSYIHSNIDYFRKRHLLRYLLIEYLLIKHNSFSFYIKNQLKTDETFLDKNGNELIGEISMDLDIEKSKFTIYPLKYAISLNHDVTILGMLINNGEGQILIEDPTHKVKVVINSNITLFGKGIYCFNHIVIARGKINQMNESFHVYLMFHPPIQNINEDTTNVILSDLFSNFNNSLLISKNREKNRDSNEKQIKTDTKHFCMKNFEDLRIKVQVSRNDYWVIISDILLTNAKAIENLRKVFSGYEKLMKDTNLQIGFILLGNFTNGDTDKNGKNEDQENIFFKNESGSSEKEQFIKLSTFNKNTHGIHFKNSHINFSKTIESFEKLKNLFREFPVLLSNSDFFIISGPNDIGPNLIPKNPLSNYYTSYLSKEFPKSKISFLSNPSVLDDGEIKMFFSRYSLTKELKEKTLFSYFGTKDVGLTTQWNIEPETLESIIPQTVLGQQHLTPTSSNIIPNLDHCLYLLPTPKILIIGDSGPSYSVKSMNQIWIVNPGSFNNTNSWVQFNVLTDSIDHVWL
ncbi:DNA polymerase epsilon subunit [Cryptosporidium ubiquitum]|uniref:DNA polymerase II subunit 2 n=1 Tax=Cryptosporidium ubiquitum TaxID=857276 RepID=A0A1J4MEC8_9CRYT|nr:DNA polymerase epsilon subunit [Cryptosporidium ubiquitum]OII71819.1 DNA polymerase epsilon subunit [Cryptosporidium ubiquitum]